MYEGVGSEAEGTVSSDAAHALIPCGRRAVPPLQLHLSCTWHESGSVRGWGLGLSVVYSIWFSLECKIDDASSELSQPAGGSQPQPGTFSFRDACEEGSSR